MNESQLLSETRGEQLWICSWLTAIIEMNERKQRGVTPRIIVMESGREIHRHGTDTFALYSIWSRLLLSIYALEILTFTMFSHTSSPQTKQEWRHGRFTSTRQSPLKLFSFINSLFQKPKIFHFIFLNQTHEITINKWRREQTLVKTKTKRR